MTKKSQGIPTHFRKRLIYLSIISQPKQKRKQIEDKKDMGAKGKIEKRVLREKGYKTVCVLAFPILR
jgi:hypothetical protein